MDKIETTEALAALGMMLQAFPSARSSITADSPKVYLFAVEEFSLDALKVACRQIVRGEVKDLKPDFPPTAPRLAQLVKEADSRIKVERYEAERPFVESGSIIWEKLCLLRKDKYLPAFTRTFPDGHQRKGWNFLRAEIEEADRLTLPPPIPEADRLQRIDDLAKRGVTAGDPEGDRDVA